MYWFWYITVIPYGGTYIIYYLCILEVLNPHFQESFHISKAMSALTQAAVYGAYFLMALPACRMDYPEVGLQEGCDNTC